METDYRKNSYLAPLLAIILLLFTVYVVNKDYDVIIDYSLPDIPVAEEVMEDFHDFVMFCREKGIHIDYSKISSIKYVNKIAPITPYGGPPIGVYNQLNKSIILDDYIYNNHRDEDGDFALYVLAHEIAHSQGIFHTRYDLLMHPSEDSFYFVKASGMSVKEAIFLTFKKHGLLCDFIYSPNGHEKQPLNHSWMSEEMSLWMREERS